MYTYIIEFLDDDGTLYIYNIEKAKIKYRILNNFFIIFWGLSLQVEISCDMCRIRKVEYNQYDYNYKLNILLNNIEKYIDKKIHVIETHKPLYDTQFEKILKKYNDYYKKHTIDFLSKLENINDLYNKICNIIEHRNKYIHNLSKLCNIEEDRIYVKYNYWDVWNDYSLSYEDRILKILSSRCETKDEVKEIINYCKNLYKKIQNNEI